MASEANGADALVQALINQNIHYVFGVPGAKVDRLFDRLQYPTDPRSPQLIVTHHEQNAAFMAAGIGRLTGQPGVVATTSGPGVSNLATGLITATSEGDPVIALGGQVPRNDEARLTHQSIPSQALLTAATKASVEVQDANALSEVFANAYQSAVAPKAGATFISLPQDVLAQPVTAASLPSLTPITEGSAPAQTLSQIADKLKHAKLPVILAGMRASATDVTQALRRLLRHYQLPVVETFQGAGIISRDLLADYFGRVGLFRNQIGDTLLKQSDLVLTIGYDPVEYEARIWNQDRTGEIIALDSVVPEITTDYQPNLVVQTDIAQTLTDLQTHLPETTWSTTTQTLLDHLRAQFEAADTLPAATNTHGVHPLAIIHALQDQVTDDTTVTVDVGSHYIWMARHFRSFQPRHLLFSNGMQTLGVALPWAIAAALERPGQPVVSVAGDGGFLFSGQELETAVRLHLPIVQLIWNDHHYNMVQFQEQAKYGRDSGVGIGSVDFAQYAQSFGAHGVHANTPAELVTALQVAFNTAGPTVIDIPVDYRDNAKFVTDLLPDVLN